MKVKTNPLLLCGWTGADVQLMSESPPPPFALPFLFKSMSSWERTNTMLAVIRDHFCALSFKCWSAQISPLTFVEHIVVSLDYMEK